MSKWNFNQELLEIAIEKGQSFLLSSGLSKQDKRDIKSDIKRFQLFLAGDFDDIERKRYQNMPYLKNNILSGMKKMEKVLSPELRTWLINLCMAKLFEVDNEIPIFNMDFDEISRETLKNYKKYAPVLYNFAHFMLKRKNPGLIQSAALNTSSYCFYSDILRLPFMVIDPLDDASSLNHEMEHGIEYLINANQHPFYGEFGPIYFEMLFCDGLYNKYGQSSLAMHLTRMDDATNQLNILTVYLCAMRIFAKHNYEVSDQLFLETFANLKNINNEKLLIFLNDEIVNVNIVETINYLLSFLRSIEVRELTMKDNNMAGVIFNDTLFKNRFKFHIPDDNYKLYERYVSEIKQKMR